MKTPLILFLVIAAVLMSLPQSAQAATPLPASPWYAVAWVKATDTLHWINTNGEQGSLPRPKLANEAPNALRQIRITPNGQQMVLVTPLTSNNLGIGFYDFNAGQFVQSHEAQPGEIIPDYSQIAFSFTGTQVALSLRNSNTQEWRVLVFETATGNVLDQLTRTSPTLPNTFTTDPAWWPVVADFNVDEGMGQTFVSLQLVTNTSTQTMFPSFHWYPNPAPIVADAPVVPAALPYSPFAGVDVRRTTKTVAFTGFDDANGTPPTNLLGNFIGTQSAANQLPVPVVNGAGYTLNSPQWLKNGAWIGYRIQNNVQQPHYAVTEATTDTSLPLGPNIGSIHSTPDGFVAINAADWQLYHAVDLNMEAFASQFGSTIFAPGSAFSVVYTTPEGAPFTLGSLPTEAELNVPLGGTGQVQAPELTCGTAPTPRLTVGGSARVAFTDGVPLNIRTAAAGDYLMQLPEGTPVTVVGGPVCADNYLWWNLQLESGGTTVGGWAAEGDSSTYWLEPYSDAQFDIAVAPTVVPTQPVIIQVATLQPTATAPQIVQAPATQAPPPRADSPGDGDCSNAPVGAELTVGAYANTNVDGTLAMRTNLGDAYPSQSVPTNQTVNVLGGPACNGGFRMWYVSLTLNGTPVQGWVPDGYGSNRYLRPGPARAK